MWNRLERFLFVHFAEMLILSGVTILLFVMGSAIYDRSRLSSSITRTYSHMVELVNALQIYSLENPQSRVFAPDMSRVDPGVVLAPIRENNLHGLSFLTTPIAFLESIPDDPFMSRAMVGANQTSVALHWVRMVMDEQQRDWSINSIGWGAMSVGPSLRLPPQYDVTVLREVPYETAALRGNLYHPSNGLASVGILYHDSLGNRTRL